MQETAQALTQITIDLDTALTIGVALVVFLINGPLAFIAVRIVKDQRQISQDLKDWSHEVSAIEEKLNTKHHEFRGEVYRDYIRKEDINPRLAHMESILDEIFNKLDHKADK